jgi:hypothetical protein
MASILLRGVYLKKVLSILQRLKFSQVFYKLNKKKYASYYFVAASRCGKISVVLSHFDKLSVTCKINIKVIEVFYQSTRVASLFLRSKKTLMCS